jgi:tetratricopeptide (TPR) repeat protein
MSRRKSLFIDPQVLTKIAKIAPDTKQRILRYATRRARMVADAGCPTASDEPSILVEDAIADTLTGVVIWDRRFGLGYHLCSVVRSRTSKQIKHAKRRTHLSLDAASDRAGLVALDSIVGTHAQARPDASLERAQVVRKLYASIRERATRDASLTLLLDAYAVGWFKPREVMKLTGLTRAEFLNARRRLDRILVSIPSLYGLTMNENQKRLGDMFDYAMKLRDAGDLVGARRLLESLVESLELEDRDLLSHTHSQLGRICERLGDHRKREAHFRAAIAAMPDYDLPSLGLFEALYDQGRLTEGLQEMVRLMRLSYSKDYAEVALEISELHADQFTALQRELIGEVLRQVAKRLRN